MYSLTGCAFIRLVQRVEIEQGLGFYGLGYECLNEIVFFRKLFIVRIDRGRNNVYINLLFNLSMYFFEVGKKIPATIARHVQIKENNIRKYFGVGRMTFKKAHAYLSIQAVYGIWKQVEFIKHFLHDNVLDGIVVNH